MGFAIYLNGTSSAGKTTIARALQNALEEMTVVTGIDLLIREMLPQKYFLDKGGFQDFHWVQENNLQGISVPRLYMGERAQKSYKALVCASIGLLGAGYNLIIDDVAIMGKWQFDLWQLALQPYNALFVGVHCPLDEIEKREKARGDRPLNSARGQLDIVHKDIFYDLEVDTYMETTDAIVKKIMKHDSLLV